MDDLLGGKFVAEERMLLNAEVMRGGRKIVSESCPQRGCYR